MPCFSNNLTVWSRNRALRASNFPLAAVYTRNSYSGEEAFGAGWGAWAVRAAHIAANVPRVRARRVTGRILGDREGDGCGPGIPICMGVAVQKESPAGYAGAGEWKKYPPVVRTGGRGSRRRVGGGHL